MACTPSPDDRQSFSAAAAPSRYARPDAPTDHPHRGVTEFVSHCFVPSDWIEIRCIESFERNRKRVSELRDRLWYRRDELGSPSVLSRLHALNEKNANIYFGVQPRTGPGSTEVPLVRSLWVDIDHVFPEEALRRVPPLVPPSIVVRSGHGTHLYWRLSEPVLFASQEARSEFAARLKNFGRELSADACHNVDRFLRLPTFQNRKNCRNGTPPTPCEVVSISDVTYPYAAFARWHVEESKSTRPAELAEFPSLVAPRSTRSEQRIAGILRYLTEDVPDRSSRDFGAVLLLRRLGVSPSEILELVSGLSKFTDNPKYTQRTIERAMAAFQREQG